ncbi:hypothetical protein [Salipiger bermudensis]
MPSSRRSIAPSSPPRRCSSWIGEGLSLRQALGAGMVLAGLAVVAV